ncbi:PRC-barrel domain-containing protein [Candidatus Berkelbacteria bacterium]|nr:PRC-barrel domain-containing protein [Candidatus Berkelbacteria bacterium]
MLIELEVLRKLPVAALADEERIGTIQEVVLDPDSGELVGFWVQPTGWFTARRALSSRDVVSYDTQAIVVQSEAVLLPPEEIQPFKSVVRRNERWVGKRVETESGQRLGHVSTLVIDTDLEILAKLHVSSLFGPERVLARTEIVRVTPAAIIVKNTFGTASAQLAPAAKEVAA